MTIHDAHTHTLTLSHRENFSDGLTKLEAYVIHLPSDQPTNGQSSIDQLYHGVRSLLFLHTLP
jgi:hypothetical protein